LQFRRGWAQWQNGPLNLRKPGSDGRPHASASLAPAYAAVHPATGHSFGSLSGMLVGTNAPPAGKPLAVAKSDYDAFERLLGDIQTAYSAEDLSALRAKVTPEMLSYFSEQLAGNASRGLINRVTDVKLLQGGRSSGSLARKRYR
jgi:predicted lipid-binding transport protein (Tim44 family)